MKYSIGIDLGGTTIKAGLVSITGKISHQLGLPTFVNAGPKAVASQIAEAVHQLSAKTYQEKTTDIIGIGLGAPGLIIAESGVVHFSPNFPTWADIPLVDYVRNELSAARVNQAAPENTDLPVFMDNDVNVMTLGELHYGAGVGYHNIVALTLGTGVGGGIAINRKIYRGSMNTGGELGHTVVEPKGRYCGCGNQGCLEAYAGAKNIVERTQVEIERGRITDLAPVPALTPARIAEAASAGDKLAIEIFAQTGHYIGIALTSISHILNPQIAIIGGGIAAAGEKLLFQHIRSEFDKRTMDIPAHMKIVKAHLGNSAGIVGAAKLAFELAGR